MTITSGNRKLLSVVAVLALAGAASGLAAAGSSSVSTPQVGPNVTVPADKMAAMSNRMPSSAVDSTGASGAAAPTSFTPDPLPARILGPDVPVPVPASIIASTNGWLVSNGYNLVAVYAGSSGDDPTQGRVVIVRQDLRAGTQTMQVIDAGSTGALAVAANAPIGTAVETSALTGWLTLNTSRGTKLKLNLSSNTLG